MIDYNIQWFKDEFEAVLSKYLKKHSKGNKSGQFGIGESFSIEIPSKIEGIVIFWDSGVIYINFFDTTNNDVKDIINVLALPENEESMQLSEVSSKRIAVAFSEFKRIVNDFL